MKKMQRTYQSAKDIDENSKFPIMSGIVLAVISIINISDVKSPRFMTIFTRLWTAVMIFSSTIFAACDDISCRKQRIKESCDIVPVGVELDLL